MRATGARIDHSEAGLYLWVTRDEDCWTTIDWLAGLGIVAAPGTFYGPAGSRHVRLALTASDERIARGRRRLGRLSRAAGAQPHSSSATAPEASLASEFDRHRLVLLVRLGEAARCTAWATSVSRPVSHPGTWTSRS